MNYFSTSIIAGLLSALTSIVYTPALPHSYTPEKNTPFSSPLRGRAGVGLPSPSSSPVTSYSTGACATKSSGMASTRCLPTTAFALCLKAPSLRGRLGSLEQPPMWLRPHKGERIPIRNGGQVGVGLTISLSAISNVPPPPSTNLPSSVSCFVATRSGSTVCVLMASPT